MANFSPRDVRECLDRHEELQKRLRHAAEYEGETRAQVALAAQLLQQQMVTGILREIPIEELSRQKSGIRIKLLRDSGYETVADLVDVPVKALTGIDGIGPQTGSDLCNMVRELQIQAASGIRLRLNYDSRTTAADSLVQSLYRYRAWQSHTGPIAGLRTLQARKLSPAMADVQVGKSRIKWLFTGGKKKQKAEAAYTLLREHLRGSYARDVMDLDRALSELRTVSPETAWTDFMAAPIDYYNAIDELAPGLFAREQDQVYGLPEELAQAIAAQELHLEGLRCTLRSYQTWGVKYILHQGRVLLGDEMGLGKTVQAIAAMVHLYNDGASHFFVVCPASVMSNWCREVKKFCDIPVLAIHGSDRGDELQQWMQEGGVGVTTYETARLLQLPENFHPTMLVVDEAHFVKNPKAQRTQAVCAMSARAENVLFMTGTALENKVEEMVYLMSILQPEVARSVQGMESLARAEVFRQAVAPVYYRRRREDVLTELPELMEQQEWCTMGTAEAAAYREAVLSGNIAATRRVSWNVDDLSQSSKARRLLELVDEATAENRKILVFSFFLDTIAKVQQLLGDRCVEAIDGSVPPDRRQEILDEFAAAPAGAVLPAQIIAAGTGLNIQAASVVILCEPQFKPSTEVQAISRAYRMGQGRNVLVYRLLCDDSMDERIVELLQRKQETFDAFADESVAGQQTLEMPLEETPEKQPEIDSKSFAGLMAAEAQRLEKAPTPKAAPSEV